jgi:large subunit ribosomal protein L12
MEYMYAALLLHKAKQPVNEEHMKKVLTAAGVNADAGRIKAVVAALEGSNIDDIIAKASAMTVAAAPAAGAAPAAEAKKEAKPEEKKVSEEEAAAGLSSLFG